MQQVLRDGAVAYDAVGIAGAIMNLQKGRLPASFLIPTDDPQYNKDGSNALGAYGYMLNSRTWAYDVGLALLVFTTSGDYDICREMLKRMKYEQNDDGSFNFSYDIYIGQLFDGYVRTGAMVGCLLLYTGKRGQGFCQDDKKIRGLACFQTGDGFRRPEIRSYDRRLRQLQHG